MIHTPGPGACQPVVLRHTGVGMASQAGFSTLLGGGHISAGTGCGDRRGSHRLFRALAAVKTKIFEGSLFQAALVIRATDVAGWGVFLPDDRHFHELGAFVHGVVLNLGNLRHVIPLSATCTRFIRLFFPAAARIGCPRYNNTPAGSPRCDPEWFSGLPAWR